MPHSEHRKRHADRGFTLVELLVALVLAALLLMLALPSYYDWIASSQLMHEAQHIATSMNLARSEAIKRNTRVNVCKSADGLACDTSVRWDAGWIVHVDANGNGQVDSVQDIVRGRTPLAPGITVSANRPLIDYVSYTGIGHARMLSGALQMGTFTVCRSGRNGVDVVLVASGRVRIANSPTICP